jgi:quinoprotein glucose dehydrogenase
LSGAPPEFPSLIGIGKRRDNAEITQILRQGKGRMPASPNFTDEQLSALVAYITSGANKELGTSEPASSDMPYRFTGYHRFLDPDGYPAVAPPWGTLNAINLDTGEYVWKIPFGEYPELSAAGLKNTGTENYGGPIVTAGGLVLIGATNFDNQFRAYDKATGELLWQTTLPFAGNATPATYMVNGRQFVVIAAGGGKAAKAPSGGVYVAFALEDSSKP